MDLIAGFVLVALALPVAVLAGWYLADGHGGFASLVDRGGSAGWWRATMPWPQGVQEEDGVTWHLRDADAADAPSARPLVPPENAHDAFEVAPIRPRTRIGFRRKPPG